MAQRKSLPPLAVIIKSPNFSVTRVASPVSSNAKTSATRAASGLVLLALAFVLWVVLALVSFASTVMSSGRTPSTTSSTSAPVLANTKPGTRTPGAVNTPPASRPGTRFMGGEPMKPATNRLAGRS